MAHMTRYSRQMRHTLVCGMSAACLACLFAIPFAEKKLLKNEVGYYSIVLDGSEIGSANTREEAEQALADARRRFGQESDAAVYMDNRIEIIEQSKIVAERMQEDELSDAIYSRLFACVADKESETAYTVRIDDFMVTLASKQDVVELMERVTSKYDENNEFQVDLSASSDSAGTYAVDVVKSQITSTDTDIVAAAVNGETPAITEDGEVHQDGITGISFKQNVVVNETLAATANIVSVDEAYEEITKEKEENEVYYVEEGDCLSMIANNHGLSMEELFALNEGMNEDSLILPGDEIIITVPVSEISVIMTKEMTYEENYNAEVQYVEDNTAYRGQNTVISEGTTGYRRVTAAITYENGVQTDIQYLEETILEESEPQVISVGTLTPPDYLKPVYGGILTSTFGGRWGAFHKGVDWSVSVGTPVRAAASGTVVRAGFYSDYGYCIDIQHTDGSMTRYAHLSSISVSKGQSVSQSEQIGASGNTGDSTGPHLHFEIWIGGSPVNPLNYVSK